MEVILIKDMDLGHTCAKYTAFYFLLPSLRIIGYKLRIDQSICIHLI